MRFPQEIWSSRAEALAALVKIAEAPAGPLLLLDRLGNVVFLNSAAEAFWGERAGALVNRAAISLLGLDRRGGGAAAFCAALEGGQGWEGRVRPRREAPGAQGRSSPARWAVLEPVAVEAATGRRRLAGAIVTLRKP